MKKTGKQLDREIAAVLAKPRSRPRQLSRANRAARAAAISEYVGPLSDRAALVREIADETEYMQELEKLRARLPDALWIGHDKGSDRWFVQSAEPVWNTVDPDGEDPAAWNQIERPEIARILVEDA